MLKGLAFSPPSQEGVSPSHPSMSRQWLSPNLHPGRLPEQNNSAILEMSLWLPSLVVDLSSLSLSFPL